MLRRVTETLLRATAASLLFACAASEPAPPPPSVVLISIDSLRADRLGAYGAERDTSPAMDRLAAQGIRFDNAMATTSWTLPSHVSLMTGMSPPVHGVNAPFHRIDPARDLLAEAFQANGYRTAAFVSAPFLHRAYGFDRGFDIYENFQGRREAQIPPKADAHQASHSDQTAPTVVAAAVEWLTQRQAAEEPYFLFVHLWDVHYDFIPPESYVERFDPDYEGTIDPRGFEENPEIRADMDPRDLEHLEARYDAEIRWVDDQLATLLERVDAAGDGPPVIVSLVADHGDEFFEHGKKGHMKALFEESIRIPWLLSYPGTLQPGVVEGVVALDDVGPTLLGLAGIEGLGEAGGADWSEALRAGDAAVGGEKLITLLTGDAVLRGPGWKVLKKQASGYAVYYDLEADPGERSPKPARQAAPEAHRRLEAALAAAAARAEALPKREADATVELDDDTEERLRALGYVD